MQKGKEKKEKEDPVGGSSSGPPASTPPRTHPAPSEISPAPCTDPNLVPLSLSAVAERIAQSRTRTLPAYAVQANSLPQSSACPSAAKLQRVFAVEGDKQKECARSELRSYACIGRGYRGKKGRRREKTRRKGGGLRLGEVGCRLRHQELCAGGVQEHAGNRVEYHRKMID